MSDSENPDESDATVMELPLAELRVRVTAAGDLIDKLRQYFARNDPLLDELHAQALAAPGGTDNDDDDDDDDAMSALEAEASVLDQEVRQVGGMTVIEPALAEETTTLVAQSATTIMQLLPGVSDLALNRREEVDKWRAQMDEARTMLEEIDATHDPGDLTPEQIAEVREDVERSEVVLHAYDLVVGLFDDIEARRQKILNRMAERARRAQVPSTRN